MAIHPQLALTMRVSEEAGFDNFFTGANDELFAWVTGRLTGVSDQVCYIWGNSGCGKTHLLQASVRQQGGVYLPMHDIIKLPPEVLEGLNTCDQVCVDDIEAIAGVADWEAAMFTLYNACRESDVRLIIAGHTAPAGLTLALPDLRSRLGGGLVYALKPLDDDALLKALTNRAERRGLELPEEVGRYLLHRIPRDAASLFGMLNHLDEASLVSKRRLTIPLVRAVLDDLVARHVPF